MKIKFTRILMLVILFVASGLMMNLSAQKNLGKWSEKAGKKESVNYSLISKKDKETKEIISNMISISFNVNEEQALYNELLDAAQADNKDAIQIIESKKGGELRPEIYKFYDPARKEYTTYIFSIDKKSVSVVITTKREEDKKVQQEKIKNIGSSKNSHNPR